MKLEEFSREIQRRGLGAAVLISSGAAKDSNITYLAGAEAFDFLAVLVTRKAATLFVLPHEEPSVRRTSKITNIVAVNSDFWKRLSSMTRARRIGINEAAISVRSMKNLRKHLGNPALCDVSDILIGLRETKTEKEVALIRKACSATDKIFSEVLGGLRKSRFSTESEVAAFILKRIAEMGMKPAFEPIVASGKNAAVIHHRPTPKRLSKGFMVIDFGARHRGYCSDMTRTVYLGSPSARERELYELVLRAQEESISFIRPGVFGSGAEDAARAVLGAFAKNFTHSLGHQIGVDVHEGRRVFAKPDKMKLRQGMVLTVEPGVYFKGKTGIRIEDTVVVTKTGAKPLTLSGKGLVAFSY